MIVYNLEVGVIIDKDNPTYNDYLCFDNKYSLFDESYLNLFDLNKLKEYGRYYVENGVVNTYAIITKIDLNGATDKELEEFIKQQIEELMFIEESIDILDGEQYNKDNIVWAIYKDKDGKEKALPF